jgi:hypothetical protein
MISPKETWVQKAVTPGLEKRSGAGSSVQLGSNIVTAMMQKNRQNKRKLFITNGIAP